MFRSIVLLAAAMTAFAWSMAWADDKPTSAPANWVKVGEDEAWYQSEKKAEQVFRGTLQAVPNADKPGILMRTSYYRLGERTVFTSAKKVAALDERIGKMVEIRGKAVDMELEGQNLHELWPGAVRTVE